MSLEIGEWYYRWAKGKAQSFVASETEPLAKVIKTLSTVLQDGRISLEDVERMLPEIERESVEAPFIRRQPYYFDRRKRLDQLKRMLRTQR